MNPSDPLQNETADTRLNRLLAHLDSTEPPAGFNERLLQRLESHAGRELRPSRLARGTWAPSRPVWVLGLGCAVAAGLATLSFLPAHTKPPRQPGRPGLVLRMQPAPLIPARAVPRQPSHLQTSPLAAQTHPTLAPEKGQGAQSQSLEEAQALDDLHAPSQPAPPMPLTAQERLLTSMVRKDNGQQLAQLAPDPAGSLPGGERAALQQFFDPPPVPQPEDPSPAPPSVPTSSPSQGKVQ